MTVAYREIDIGAASGFDYPGPALRFTSDGLLVFTNTTREGTTEVRLVDVDGTKREAFELSTPGFHIGTFTLDRLDHVYVYLLKYLLDEETKTPLECPRKIVVFARNGDLQGEIELTAHDRESRGRGRPHSAHRQMGL